MENFEQYSQLSLFSALLVYALAFIFFAVDLANRAASDVDSVRADGSRVRSRAERIGFSLTVLAWFFHLAATVLRGIEGGRVPWANMYEFSLTATLSIVAVFIVMQFFYDMRFLGTLITGLTLVFLGVTRVNFFTASVPLPPALDSYWLILHIMVAVLAVGFLTLSFGLSIAQLMQTRRERIVTQLARDADTAGAAAPAVSSGWTATPATATPASATASVATAEVSAEAAPAEAAAGTTTLTEAPAGGSAGEAPGSTTPPKAPFAFLRSFPSADSLENLSYRMVIIGFVFWTFTLIAGSIWAEHAWGRYWGWDTKEVWTFIIWVLYAGYIHARATRGWRGSRSAWLCIIAYSTVIFNFTIVNLFFKGLHAYSGL